MPLAHPSASDSAALLLRVALGIMYIAHSVVLKWMTFTLAGTAEYFESLGDVWEMFSIIAAERKRREMDPVLETIKQCQRMLDESSLGKSAARAEEIQLTRQRLAGMEEFMEVTNKIFQQFVGNAKSGLTKVAKVLLKAF